MSLVVPVTTEAPNMAVQKTARGLNQREHPPRLHRSLAPPRSMARRCFRGRAPPPARCGLGRVPRRPVRGGPLPGRCQHGRRRPAVPDEADGEAVARRSRFTATERVLRGFRRKGAERYAIRPGHPTPQTVGPDSSHK